MVDCHMVAQPAAGDAGNARYAAALVAALGATRVEGERVVALAARHTALAHLRAADEVLRVPSGNVARLGRAAARALAHVHADTAVFTYVSPPRSGCPVLLAVHDATFRTHPEWFGTRDRALLGLLVPVCAWRAAAVLALSCTAKDDLVAALGLPEERVVVVSPAPAPVFHPEPGAGERVITRWGLRRFCLAVGDVHRRKNLPALERAVRRLKAPGLELAVVGRPGHGGAHIMSASGARWLGPVSDGDLADLYRAASVVAYPSLYEGFGLPALEALACGAPLVASARGAVPEVVGDAALLVEPTAEGIAEGLRAALEPATAARLAVAGPARAAAFTPQSMGEAAWGAVRTASS